MLLTHRFSPARAVLAIAFALGLSHTALAQNAAPQAAAATFDVCADEATGRWRYSGVVTAPGLDGAQVRIDSRIQNQTSRDGYVDAAAASAGLAQARAGSTLVVPYSVEAPPLTLGVLRSAATVQLSTLTDPTLRTSDPLIFAAGDCAAMIDHPLEKAGVFAVRMGRPLADPRATVGSSPTPRSAPLSAR